MTAEELRIVIISKFLYIREIADRASSNGDLLFEIISQFAQEGIDEIENYKED